jgi:hypothetical protein
VRCGRCGNENTEENRFCGMCGAVLGANTQAAAQAPGAVPAGQVAGPVSGARQAAVPAQPVLVQSGPKQAPPAAVPGPTGLGSAAERRSAPLSSSDAGPQTGPVIPGPSFLGLNRPATGAGGGRYADGERDALRPSSSLDYLLEDEEEPRRGWGKLILVVVALALAVGFGYLHWKQGGFDWINGGDQKPAAAKQTAEAAPGGADSGGTTAATTPDAGTPQAASGAGGTAPATGDAASSPGSTAPQTAPAPTASQTPSQATPAQSTASQTDPSQSTPSQTQPADPNLPAGSAAQPVTSDSDTQPPSAETPEARVRKPSAAKPIAAKPVDQVAEAERYIYGRGVRQDCDHGLRLLKPAAEQSNPKAMISLGALYSTGTCTPRDLPTAYRWFALALHKQPDNQALQDDLQKLWSQMTQPEHQLAIKLSQ